jgi:hypothetical protein
LKNQFKLESRLHLLHQVLPAELTSVLFVKVPPVKLNLQKMKLHFPGDACIQKKWLTQKNVPGISTNCNNRLGHGV